MGAPLLSSHWPAHGRDPRFRRPTPFPGYSLGALASSLGRRPLPALLPCPHVGRQRHVTLDCHTFDWLSDRVTGKTGMFIPGLHVSRSLPLPPDPSLPPRWYSWPRFLLASRPRRQSVGCINFQFISIFPTPCRHPSMTRPPSFYVDATATLSIGSLAGQVCQFPVFMPLFPTDATRSSLPYF